MIRKLILPALAAALLAGCASYQYRGGAGGDYYYGQPSTDYRYYGNYGYPAYGTYGTYGWGGSIGYSSGYYPYGYSRYGYPRYPQRPPHHHPRPSQGSGEGPRPGPGDNSGYDPDQGQQQGQHPDRARAPWRDLGSLRERAEARDGVRQAPAMQAPAMRSAPSQRAPSQQTQQIRPAAPAQPRMQVPASGETRQKRDRHRIPGG